MEAREEHPAGRHVWLRLVADPQSLPASRRFARDAVTQWRLPDLVEDVALCVSELAANAALHSGSEYLELALVDGGTGSAARSTTTVPVPPTRSSKPAYLPGQGTGRDRSNSLQAWKL